MHGFLASPAHLVYLEFVLTRDIRQMLAEEMTVVVVDEDEEDITAQDIGGRSSRSGLPSNSNMAQMLDTV